MLRKTLSVAVAIALLGTLPAHAGAVERACVKSGKRAATASLCTCIDAVARSTLSVADQNRAGMLIRRPEKSEHVQRSKRASDRSFWKRYLAFADVAGKRCG